MRFAAAIAPGRRGAGSPTTALLVLIRAFGSVPPSSGAPEPPSSKPQNISAPQPSPHLRSAAMPLAHRGSASPRTAVRRHVRALGSEPASSGSTEPSSSGSEKQPRRREKRFCNAASNKKKLTTRDPTYYLTTHRPVEKIRLFGDSAETSTATDSFRHSLGTAIVSLIKNRRGKFSFRHPLDLRSWRINSFGGFEVANGTEITELSELNTMFDFYHLGLFLEFCLKHFGGDVPTQFSNLIDKLKCPNTDKGYCILVDPCLIPTHLWPLAFLDGFHLVMHLMTEKERKGLLDRLDIHCQGWQTDMLLNSLSNCYVLFTGPSGTLANRDKNSSRAFLECIRHALAHPLDYIELMKKLGLGTYTKQDLYRVLREKGGDKLFSHLCELLPTKYLQELALERYLCREESSCCPCPTRCIRRALSKQNLRRLALDTILALERLAERREKDEELFTPSPVLNRWKVLYSENGSDCRESATKEFWKMYGAIEGYSIWTCNGKDELGDCEGRDVANMVCGLMMQMYPCRNYSFGKMTVVGCKTGPFKVKGVWVFPGVEVPHFLMKIHGMDFYTWSKIDISNQSQRSIVNDILNARAVEVKAKDIDVEEVISDICM